MGNPIGDVLAGPSPQQPLQSAVKIMREHFVESVFLRPALAQSETSHYEPGAVLTMLAMHEAVWLHQRHCGYEVGLRRAPDHLPPPGHGGSVKLVKGHAHCLGGGIDALFLSVQFYDMVNPLAFEESPAVNSRLPAAQD